MWGEKGESMTKVFSLNRAGGDWGGGGAVDMVSGPVPLLGRQWDAAGIQG